MNKHKYFGYNENRILVHIIGGPLVGALSSDAYRQATCPKCGSGPGFLCETPKGRKAVWPHGEREKALLSTGYNAHIRRLI